jgi:poly(3-hydroxybutyrate) depolymerase
MKMLFNWLVLTLTCTALPLNDKPEPMTASTHLMKYYVSLPQGWQKDKAWPVIVVIPDATRDFAGNLAAFEKARQDLPFILVAPHVVTSGGANYRNVRSYRYADADWKKVAEAGDFRFDEQGIAAVVADVKRLYNGEERFFLTGWEAGGHTVWALTLQHPEWLRAVAPVSTNYQGRWLDEASISKSNARTSLPIEVFFCERTAASQGWDFLMKQTKAAMNIAERHGFPSIPMQTIASKPHGPLAEEVVKFFDSKRISRD